MTESEKQEFYGKLGASIANARKQAGLSQEVLAERINMSRVSIVNIEKGRQNPPVHLLWSLARTLNIDLENLIPKIRSEKNKLNSAIERKLRRKGQSGEFNEESLERISSFINKL